MIQGALKVVVVPDSRMPAMAAAWMAACAVLPWSGMTWLTFRDGRIVEGWDSWNLGRLLQSLQP
ncbi:MAG: hypothetical protein ABI592_05995 [Acidobacteriota bacterium]